MLALPLMKPTLRLTQTVQKGGCAAKIAAQDLKNILKNLKMPTRHEALLVDGSHFDDAAIYKVTDSVALVQTLDFFTPVVDTPYLFGQVAAANALSDVYAMGGTPKTAMAILAVPLTFFENQIILEVLQGACDKIQEAGANLVGGHSIDDDTLKFGLSVTGFVHLDRVWSNQRAQIGDDLILTKPLGTGTLCAGLKQSCYTENDIEDAIQSMTKLNNVVSHLNTHHLNSIHSATDITGFGISGHAMQMAKASGVRLQIDFRSLPHFAKFYESVEKGHTTKAQRTNKQYTAEDLDVQSLLPEEQILLHDPQTSGGLLLSVAPDQSQNLLEEIKNAFPHAARIGKVLPYAEGPHLVVNS